MEINTDKCQITYYPAGVLSSPAQFICKVDQGVRRLVEKMTDIMFEHKGIGLAGPQAGVPFQIFIVSLDATRASVKVYINPGLTLCGDFELMDEGCLSVPGVTAKVRRYKKCTITATDLDGNRFTEEAEGLLARVLQHENDHLQGLTIVNRMDQPAKIAHRRQLKRLIENHKKAAKS